jgi:hypothetical protein
MPQGVGIAPDKVYDEVIAALASASQVIRKSFETGT